MSVEFEQFLCDQYLGIKNRLLIVDWDKVGSVLFIKYSYPMAKYSTESKC